MLLLIGWLIKMKRATLVAWIGNTETMKRVYETFEDKTIKEFSRFAKSYTLALEPDSNELRDAIEMIKSTGEERIRLFSEVYYTKDELTSAEYFRLNTSAPLELEGTCSANYGTNHLNQCDKCLMCGELIGDLYVDRKFMKKQKIGSLFPDLFVSEEIKLAIEEAELTGVKFGGLVKDYKGREMKEKYYVMHIASVLPPLSQSTWLQKGFKCSQGHTITYLQSDLMYEREKLANAQDFNLTCEHLNNFFLQEIVVSAKVKKVLSKYRLMFREPICIL